MPDSLTDPNTNRFVKLARLYDDEADNQAQRMAQAINEPPAGQKQLSPDEVRMAWNHTTSQQPAEDFWQQHDQALQQATAQLGPNPDPNAVMAAHNQAETTALNAVYPYRAALVGIGSRVLPDQVQLADRIKRLAENDPNAPQSGESEPPSVTAAGDSTPPEAMTAPGGPA